MYFACQLPDFAQVNLDVPVGHCLWGVHAATLQKRKGNFISKVLQPLTSSSAHSCPCRCSKLQATLYSESVYDWNCVPVMKLWVLYARLTWGLILSVFWVLVFKGSGVHILEHDDWALAKARGKGWGLLPGDLLKPLGRGAGHPALGGVPCWRCVGPEMPSNLNHAVILTSDTGNGCHTMIDRLGLKQTSEMI